MKNNMIHDKNIKDINDKLLELGHIVAVRYVWNSYVGVIKMGGMYSIGAKRFAFNSPHSIEDKHTYQIIGHTEREHKDYNEDVYNWYISETMNCPVKIGVYDIDRYKLEIRKDKLKQLKNKINHGKN